MEVLDCYPNIEKFMDSPTFLLLTLLILLLSLVAIAVNSYPLLLYFESFVCKFVVQFVYSIFLRQLR